MQILSKLYQNKHLTREMAPLRVNTTDAYRIYYRQQCYFYKNRLRDLQSTVWQKYYKLKR